ncbi:hypothetical protein J4573_33185 [Actinomadura barringtoniae]|uniref:Uncharacterized protein n=1 Tax=Actinomadura barringtoniae TaxID=1427535 RepID=A0A939PGS6_9ACTN|nr:hypothetical protein [Actinomadura barringtoniae]MBO2451982.1 hypothetical protein [Actinomadura barringtoniae]
MSPSPDTRPDIPIRPVAPPLAAPSSGARLARAIRSVLGLQFLLACVVALVLTSYRRSAAGWLLPALGVIDAVVTFQIVRNAIRERLK